MINDNFLESIVSLNRYSKQIIAIITDICLCILCTWLAFIIRLEELIVFKDFKFFPAIISAFIAIPIFWLFGLYRTIFRYTSLSIIFSILVSNFTYGFIFFLILSVYGLSEVPRSVGVLQPMLLFFAVIASRLGVKLLLQFNQGSKIKSNKKNVLIYGSGEAGRQLVIALENSPEFKVLGFLDDNLKLHNQVLLGKTIYSPGSLASLINYKNISLIFLALPAINRVRRNQIIENLNKYKLAVKTLPSVSEIVDGRITISDVKDLNIDDLLNRKQVEPNQELLNKNIIMKNVLVTGAGGSIGSELCRQILRLKANKLILVEFNEFALYKIHDELKNYNSNNTKIVPLLVNVQDQSKIQIILESFKIDTVYHAAAYKHVPLVEENICEGVKNNVFSTLSIVNASIKKKVSNLVFISSDKAVRPTNIMGASKRLAELCVQGVYDKNKNNSTEFSIVRFGNVLESSGSVIPKFKKQIREGGPITLTHKDVTRYFMTITEAAQLVIQAGAIGKNSDVFVLDMGESVKILSLIKKMVKLSGLTLKDINNPNGDIEIQVIGLRPGEKLFEELLIGDNPKKTIHPKILRASDPFIPFDELNKDLNKLSISIEKNDTINVKRILSNLIKSYNSNSSLIDHIYREQMNIDHLNTDLTISKGHIKSLN